MVVSRYRSCPKKSEGIKWIYALPDLYFSVKKSMVRVIRAMSVAERAFRRNISRIRLPSNIEDRLLRESRLIISFLRSDEPKDWGTFLSFCSQNQISRRMVSIYSMRGIQHLSRRELFLLSKKVPKTDLVPEEKKKKKKKTQSDRKLWQIISCLCEECDQTSTCESG